MPRPMPAKVLAEILRRDFRQGGPKAADESCDIIEWLHGREKLDEVLLELDLLLDAEIEAWEFRRARTGAN